MRYSPLVYEELQNENKWQKIYNQEKGKEQTQIQQAFI
jgi:hypothetical protein